MIVMGTNLESSSWVWHSILQFVKTRDLNVLLTDSQAMQGVMGAVVSLIKCISWLIVSACGRRVHAFAEFVKVVGWIYIQMCGAGLCINERIDRQINPSCICSNINCCYKKAINTLYRN